MCVHVQTQPKDPKLDTFKKKDPKLVDSLLYMPESSLVHTIHRTRSKL